MLHEYDQSLTLDTRIDATVMQVCGLIAGLEPKMVRRFRAIIGLEAADRRAILYAGRNIIVSIDDVDEWYGPLADFFNENEECMNGADRAAVLRALDCGGTYRYGGGAQPIFEIRSAC